MFPQATESITMFARSNGLSLCSRKYIRWPREDRFCASEAPKRKRKRPSKQKKEREGLRVFSFYIVSISRIFLRLVTSSCGSSAGDRRFQKSRRCFNESDADFVGWLARFCETRASRVIFDKHARPRVTYLSVTHIARVPRAIYRYIIDQQPTVVPITSTLELIINITLLKERRTNYSNGIRNKILRNIINAPWYVRKKDIHRDLRIETVKEEIQHFAQKHQTKLRNHVNAKAVKLLDCKMQLRRLKRKKPHDQFLN